MMIFQNIFFPAKKSRYGRKDLAKPTQQIRSVLNMMPDNFFLLDIIPTQWVNEIVPR